MSAGTRYEDKQGFYLFPDTGALGQVPPGPTGPATPEGTAIIVGPEVLTTRRGFVAIPTDDMRAFLQMQAFTFLAGAATGFIGGFVAAALFGWTPGGIKK